MIRRPPRSTLFPYTTLFRSLSLVFARPAAELVDLGPVIGTNIAFLGERIGCKIHVEDVYADLDRHAQRSEEHTSELQSPCNLVCRLLLEKKNIESSTHRLER